MRESRNPSERCRDGQELRVPLEVGCTAEAQNGVLSRSYYTSISLPYPAWISTALSCLEEDQRFILMLEWREGEIQTRWCAGVLFARESPFAKAVVIVWAGVYMRVSNRPSWECLTLMKLANVANQVLFFECQFTSSLRIVSYWKQGGKTRFWICDLLAQFPHFEDSEP